MFARKVFDKMPHRHFPLFKKKKKIYTKLDFLKIKFYYIFLKKFIRTWFSKNWVPLNFHKIEFNVAFFIVKSPITGCHHGKKLMELDLLKIELYGILLHILRAMLFYYVFHEKVLFQHFARWSQTLLKMIWLFYNKLYLARYIRFS